MVGKYFKSLATSKSCMGFNFRMLSSLAGLWWFSAVLLLVAIFVKVLWSLQNFKTPKSFKIPYKKLAEYCTLLLLSQYFT